MGLCKMRFYPVNPVELRSRLKSVRGIRLNTKGIVMRAAYNIKLKGYNCLFIQEYHKKTVVTLQSHNIFQEYYGEKVTMSPSLDIPGCHLRGVMQFLEKMHLSEPKVIESYQEIWRVHCGIYISKVIIHWWPDLYPIVEIESESDKDGNSVAHSLGLTGSCIKEEILQIYESYAGWNKDKVASIHFLGVSNRPPKEYKK